MPARNEELNRTQQEVQILEELNNLLQNNNEELIKIALKNYINRLKAEGVVAAPFDFSNYKFVEKIKVYLSIEEIGFVFQQHEYYFLNRLQDAFKNGEKLNEVLQKVEEYELFLSRANNISAQFDPEKVERNHDLIQSTYEGYAECIINQLKLAFENNNSQQGELNTFVQKVLKAYMALLGKSLKKPIGLSSAFFDETFIEKLEPYLSVQDAVLISIYADGGKIDVREPVKAYINCFKDEKSKALLTEEYALRQKMQRSLVRGGDALRTGVETVKTLSHGGQFVNAKEEYEAFCARISLEFTADLNSLLQEFARKKFVGVNSKGSLRSGLAKGLSALSLSSEILNQERNLSAPTPQEIDAFSKSFGILEMSADVDQKTDSVPEETLIKIGMHEENWHEKDVRQLHIGVETYMATLQDEDEKFNVAIRFVSELLSKIKKPDELDESDEAVKKESQKAILAFLFNSEPDNEEMRAKVLYHFIERYSDVFKPIVYEYIDSLFEKAKLPKGEKISSMRENIKEALVQGKITREELSLIDQVFQKIHVLNEKFADFKSGMRHHKNAGQMLSAMTSGVIGYKYKLVTELHDVVVAKKDKKIIPSGLDGADRFIETIKVMTANTKQDGERVTLSESWKRRDHIHQQLVKHENEAKKDAVGWSVFGAVTKAFLIAAGAIAGAIVGFAIGSLLTGGLGGIPAGVAGAIIGAKFSLPVIICTAIGTGIGGLGGVGLAALAGGKIAHHSLKRHKAQEDKPLPKRSSCFAFFSRNKDKEKVEEKASLPIANL